MINFICSMMLLIFCGLIPACDNGKPEIPVTVEESDTTANGNTGNGEAYLKTNDPVSAIANHPASAGFGHYL
jgi:hypothetical protein